MGCPASIRASYTGGRDGSRRQGRSTDVSDRDARARICLMGRAPGSRQADFGRLLADEGIGLANRERPSSPPASSRQGSWLPTVPAGRRGEAGIAVDYRTMPERLYLSANPWEEGWPMLYVVGCPACRAPALSSEEICRRCGYDFTSPHQRLDRVRQRMEHARHKLKRSNRRRGHGRHRRRGVDTR